MKKLSKFDILIIFGLIVLVAIGTALIVKSCYNEQQENKKEYKDEDLIDMYADGVIDFIYHTQDNEYVIEYCDEDSFDQDSMLYNEDYNYYYIEIYADSCDFYDYLSWYNSINGRYNDKFINSSPDFGIIFVNQDNDFSYYKLQRKN